MLAPMGTVPPDPEWTALEAGLKPAVRVTIAPAHAARLAEGLAARGAHVVAASRRIRFASGPPETVLYIARSRATAEALREAEAHTLARDDLSPAERRTAHVRLGTLLGYPACCVEAYAARAAAFDRPGALGETAEDYLQAGHALAATRAAPRARLNNLLLSARIRLVTFYPCAYDCPAAGAYADALAAAVARKDAAAALALDADLRCVVALAPRGARAILVPAPDAPERWVDARPPPRPNGAMFARGDEAFARALAERLAAGAPPPADVLVVAFARP
jgi:hypothetical protein